MITVCVCLSGLVLYCDQCCSLNCALQLYPANETVSSEVVVASVVFVVIRVITDIAIAVTITITIFFSLFIVVRLFIIGLEAAFSLVLTLGSEASLGLPHLIELRVVLVIRIVLENLIFLVLQVLVLQFLDNLLLLGAALAILEVVHVEFILQVVDIRVLLDVSAVESLKFSLKSLVLLLELRLHVFDTLETLIRAFKLDSAALNSVLKNGLVAAE